MMYRVLINKKQYVTNMLPISYKLEIGKRYLTKNNVFDLSKKHHWFTTGLLLGIVLLLALIVVRLSSRYG